jgi:hypothetical protein
MYNIHLFSYILSLIDIYKMNVTGYMYNINYNIHWHSHLTSYVIIFYNNFSENKISDNAL